MKINFCRNDIKETDFLIKESADIVDGAANAISTPEADA
jgi:hypothetical protein